MAKDQSLVDSPFLYTAQPIEQGINGRVARTTRAAQVPDARLDPDYLRREPRTDPDSELSLPIMDSTWSGWPPAPRSR
ncbi:MAG: hypothetical protein NVSMB25_11440 [Thermoleophilaceae bacterium]